MNDSLSISIIVPSYNQNQWVRYCLNSILQQKTVLDQVIVVDNCSDDGTQEILKQFADQIDTLIIESDNGQADALRKGFELAKGDIFAYLNTDDILLPGAFKYIRDYYSKHLEVDAIYSHRVSIDVQNNPTGHWIIPLHSDYCMKRWDYIPQETCFWRRSLMERVGGIDAEYQFAMDYDLFVRMMYIGRFRRVNKFLACFRDHPDTKTNSQYETIGKSEIRAIHEKYQVEFSWYDRLIGNAYGQLVLRIGSLVYFVEALRRHSRLKKNILKSVGEGV